MTKNIFFYLGLFFLAVFLNQACVRQYQVNPVAPSLSAPTFTSTPTVTGTITPPPTSTATPVPPTATPTPVPPTATPTPNPASAVTVVAAFFAAGTGGTGLTCSPAVIVAVNQAPETFDSVYFNTPANGSVSLEYFGNNSLGSFSGAEYAAPGLTAYSYIPNAVYSFAVSTSLGIANATVTAPGDINYSSNGSSVTCVYPGNLATAEVEMAYPSFSITYATAAGTNEPATLVFPSAAYYTPSSPATFAASYVAGVTVGFTGTANHTGYLEVYQDALGTFTR